MSPTNTTPVPTNTTPVLTYVEGLAVIARFVGEVPHVVRLATDADRERFNYRPMARDVAAHRAAWDRLAANGG